MYEDCENPMSDADIEARVYLYLSALDGIHTETDRRAFTKALLSRVELMPKWARWTFDEYLHHPTEPLGSK